MLFKIRESTTYMIVGVGVNVETVGDNWVVAFEKRINSFVLRGFLDSNLRKIIGTVEHNIVLEN